MSGLTLFLASLVAFVLAVGLMAVGAIAGRSPITGSCGGLGMIPGVTPDCGGTCRRPCPRRRREGAS